MKQKTIKSQTTQILHPNQTFNLRPSRISIILVNARDFIVFIGFSLVMWFVITAFLSYVIGG